MGWESSGVDQFDLGSLLQGQTRIAKLKSAYNSLIWLEICHASTISRLGIHCVETQYLVMSTPLGGGHIIFAFSAVRHHTWFLVISKKSIYPIFTKYVMSVYWVNSLHGIAFGEDSCIAN